MKPTKRILADAQRCLMCHRPVCTAACPHGVTPSRAMQSLHLENEPGARRWIAGHGGCAGCDDAKCEKACLRGRLDRPVSIREICLTLAEEPVPPLEPADLSVEICGLSCENPFFLASSPVASSYEMCCRAFDAGWAGVFYKTISFYQSDEVSPRFDALGYPFRGFKNLEQLSPHTPEENFAILRRLKAAYPRKIVAASIMGQNEEEWERLAGMAETADADLVECNFSCPQVAKTGLGSDVGQRPDLIARYTRATRRGTSLPVVAKMTPNLGNMEPAGLAAAENGADALAAINTVKCLTRINPETGVSYPDVYGKSSVGGYSGSAVKPVALRFIRDMAVYPPLENVPLFGIGGIATWRDALDFLLLGCSGVQVCTSVMEYGYRIIDDLKEGLSDYMRSHGIASLDQLRGRALPNVVAPEELNRRDRNRCEIDADACIGCGRCYVSCRDGGHQAIEWLGRRPAVTEPACVGCGLCALVCPTGAVRLVRS